MSFQHELKSGSSSDIADVDVNKQLKVALSNTPAQMGGVKMFSVNDITSNTVASPETSDDSRLRVGLDVMYDAEVFNYTAQNTSKHSYTTSTLTFGWGGSSITTNSSAITTLNTRAFLRSYQYFPLMNPGTTYLDFALAYENAMATNTTLEVGLHLPVAGTDPVDAIMVRLNASGISLVTINNSVETSQAAAFVPVVGERMIFVIAISRIKVRLWINDVLQASIDLPNGLGSFTSAGALPFGIQHRIGGTAAGAVFQAALFNYNVTVGDTDLSARPWTTTNGAMGFSAVQGASGHTQGQSANYTNSAAPASATLSNTTAGYATLGGQFQFVAVAGAETDYALFAFLNPAPTVNIQGRNLIIKGIWIDTYNTGAAVATTPHVLQWAVSLGGTAVSLATAESGTARAPRRLPLGVQYLPVGAVIGAKADSRLSEDLEAGGVVHPGTYLHIILKMPIATATASQVIRGVVGINAYWD